MNACCTIRSCGSYAVNIDKSGVLCDVHFYKVQRDELLEALQEILKDGLHCDVVPHLHRKAIAAIAKATESAA